MVSSVDELKKKIFLIPGAVKGLELPSDFDFMISISSGFSHGFHIQGVKHYSYIYEWDFFFQGKVGLLSKLFKMYINGWRKEALENSDLMSFQMRFWRSRLELRLKKLFFHSLSLIKFYLMIKSILSNKKKELS